MRNHPLPATAGQVPPGQDRPALDIEAVARADGRVRPDRGRDVHHSRHLHQLLARLPGPIRSALTWVLRPEAKWLRIPLGVVLIPCGFLGFLPILGFWMIPLGVLLLAEDFPTVRRPTVRAIDALASWWERRRASAHGRRETHDSLHP